MPIPVCSNPECGVANRRGAKFCIACGSRLVDIADWSLGKGTVLRGRYHVVKLISKGGMGAIYLAIDIGLFERQVAVKEMLTPLADPDEREQSRMMFEQEARLLATLRHGNMPAIFDYFSEQNRQYLVMEFIDGKNLQQVLDEAPAFLTEEQVLPWIVQVGEALTYSHSQIPPIIFRDLKPKNIMLDRGGVIKLIDFGIARIFATGKIKDTAILGTPGYAPPEQHGVAQTDVRSDVYALGVTLHELLTKHDPSTTPFNLPRARTINPSVSAGTEAVIVKATKSAHTERFQTVAEMVDALRAQKTELLVQPPAKVRPVPPFPVEGTPILAHSWTMQLSTGLDEAKTGLFCESREGLVSNIVGAVLKEDVEITGITIMLRGVEGFGGTSIATRVKDNILSSGKAVTLVATLDLSDLRHLAEPTRTLEEILSALKRGSGSIGRELRNAVREAYKRQVKAKQPVTREIETQRRTSLTPFPISLEVVTPWGKASLGSPYAHETQVSEREVSEPLDAEQRLLDLLDTLRQLTDYLLSEDVRVILIFDKVKDISVLNPLVPIASRGGVYSIVIANMDDCTVWRQQYPELLKRFSKWDFYVPCVWNLPQQLCKSLTRDRPEADSKEFYMFHKFLEYRGRGVPDRTIKEIVRFYSPPKKTTGIIDWLKRRILRVKHPAQIAVLGTQWPEITRCFDLQQRLEASWWQIFDPQQGIPSLDSVTEETADRARVAMYTLTDWLIEQAEKGTKVSKQAVTDHALAECKMPFDERVSKQVVIQFITFLIQEGKATSTSRGLDLSGLLTTPPFSDQSRSANRTWGRVG